MKRKKLIGKKYRRVYQYVCHRCQKRRIAFSFERSRNEICARCEREAPNENQIKLFEN
jgi:hypothetical protein